MFPAFTIEGYGGFGQAVNEMWGRQEGHSGLASLSRIAGSHVMKTGADLRLGRVNGFANSQCARRYYFGRVFTQGPSALQASTTAGNAIATAILGYPHTGGLIFGANAAPQSWYHGFYFQGD